MRERLTGFEPKTPPKAGWQQWAAEVAAFPEYYENYFSRRMMGGSIAPRTPLVCTGPIAYRGQEAIRQDIANLKSAISGVDVAEAFMPAVAPSGVGRNEYYGWTKNFSPRSATLCAKNIWRSSMPDSSCRSTIPG